jgi:plasmid stability protein
MANLSIRKLDEDVFSRLRMLASTHGFNGRRGAPNS